MRSHRHFSPVIVFILPILLLVQCTSGSDSNSTLNNILQYNSVTAIQYQDYALTASLTDGADDFDAIGSSKIKMYEPSDYNSIQNVNLQFTLNNTGTAKDIYFIFTNIEPYASTIYPALNNINQDIIQSIVPVNSKKAQLVDLKTPDIGIRGKPEVSEFNKNPFVFLNRINPVNMLLSIMPSSEPLYDTAGSSMTFKIDSSTSVLATCIETRTVTTLKGIKNLNIWVANNCFTGGTKANLVNETMVTELADKFLKTGSSDDIYDWVTGIYGEEWGDLSTSSLSAQDKARLIPADKNSDITILLFDINNDNSTTGGILGYFWAKDNFTTDACSYSNERIMFYLDAVLFATPTDAWDISDKRPSEIVSTLAHEFQHMIHFYQKNLLRTGGSGTEVWIDEMCSMATEDMVADKLEVNGPRGVNYWDATDGSAGNTFGRLPYYIYYNDWPVTYWPSTSDSQYIPKALISYSANYALGAYLSRNFGGATFFKNVVYNQYTDYRAINYALLQSGSSDNFGSILRKWAVAGLLSDDTGTTAGYQFNADAWFTSSLDATDYYLGSINLFNYMYNSITGPFVYNTGNMPSGTMPMASNQYYKAANNFAGTHTWNIPMTHSVRLTVIIR